MNRILFYLQYAARNLWRNRRWSAFAVFSIAAGVAAMVALRSLGLAIGDSLTSNLRSNNKGDVRLALFTPGGFSFTFSDPNDDSTAFNNAEIRRVEQWTADQGGQMTTYINSSTVQIAGVNTVTAGRPQFITTIFIHPSTYPPTQDIRAVDPPGIPLGELFQGGDEVVISKNLAENQKIAVGDHVRVSGTTDEYIVRGIVPTETEAGFDNLFTAFFGFAYLDITQAEKLSISPMPNGISIALPEGAAPATREDSEQMEESLRALLGGRIGRRSVSITTVPDLLQRNEIIAEYTATFIVVMGLGAMLIGGVGIVNTMLVMVRRRTEEIAALKTFGLKGRQVAALFLAEAVLLGAVGSLVGGGIGIFLSALANAYGETLIQQPLAFRVYPEAVLFGLVLGVVVSAVFGVLPVLTAARIRPGIILRPNETHIPRAGCLQQLAGMLFIVIALGLIAGQIISPAISRIPVSVRPNTYMIGLVSVSSTLAFLGFLTLLLWVVVWVIGRMPAFGWVDLRLALRNLRSKRLRTATTVLAISAGMFALSSITFFGAGVRQILQTTLSGSLGGNVMIFPVLPAAIANPLIDNRLDSLEGVQSRTRYISFDANIVSINGERVDAGRERQRRDEILSELREASRRQDFARVGELAAELETVTEFNLSLTMRDTTGDDFGGGSVQQGRGLQPADRGQRVAVIALDQGLRNAGIQPGSLVTFEIGGQEYDFEVVGTLSDESSSGGFSANASFGDVTVPPGALPAASASQFQLTLAQVDEAHLDTVLLSLSSLPLVFSIDITFIDNLLRRFIDQFSALPILVGLLSLGAAAVIMANTVALATLERRKQIGILKAIGLKGRRVLWIMLLENILVSLLGGVIGIGLSALGVWAMSALSLDLGFLIPSDATAGAVMLVIAAVGIGSLATFLSAQVAVSERVTNVLRYE